MKQNAELNYIKNDGYAKLVAHGFDTMVEVYKTAIPCELKERLTQKRNEASERDAGKGEGLSLKFGGQEFQINPYRAKGVEFILKNEYYTIDFMYTEWNVKVTFHPPVLWEMGIEKARENLIDILFKEIRPVGDDWARVSTAHYAFDFYAPEFDNEMRPEILNNFVCVSGVKKRVMGKLDFDFFMKGARGETVTLGTKRALQLQIYDKTTEIKEFSGKYWMYDLWAQSGLEINENSPARIWRVEIRFGKDHLKNRDKSDMRRFECLIPCIFELCCEALENRRLTCPNYKDSNKARWHMHPLWTAIFDACGNPPERIPLGRIIEKTSQEMEEMFLMNVAGDLRSRGVMKHGKYDREEAQKFIERILDQIENDPEHELKVERAQERYKYIDYAK
jgi:hypothetical protein